MKVHGDVKPEKISANSQPNKPGMAWVRICLNSQEETLENDIPAGYMTSMLLRLPTALTCRSV